MKSTFSWLPVLGLCFLLVQGAGCAKSPQASGLSPEDFQAALSANPDALLVDIYLQEKPRKIGLPKAQVLKVGKQKPREAFSNVDHARPVYLYCGDGRGSGQIAKILDDMGFQEVYSLEGGIKAWKKAGLPVEPLENLPAFGQADPGTMP